MRIGPAGDRNQRADTDVGELRMPARELTTDFRTFSFGYASAEMESTNEPNLLLRGFFDIGSVIDEAVGGRRFVFLGYKGSGKSAITEHLKLLSRADGNLFVTSTYLSDFPYSDFKKIVKGDSEPESKYPTAWSWLLLMSLFSSFSKDMGATPEDRLEFDSAIAALKEMGFLPAPTLKEVVLVSSKRSFKLSIPTILEIGYEKNLQNEGRELPFFVERLKTIAGKFRSGNRHILIIDGLDDILTYRQIQYQSLAALLLEVSRLNLAFFQNSVPAKVVLLCRTDLFERLPGANKNKIRQDCSLQLDWYHDPREPDNAMLIKLLHLRANVNRTTSIDVFKQFFPPQIEGQNIKTYLLHFTRHTPRDLIQLINHIQKFSKDGKLTVGNIFSGVRSYSINYFLPEIRDELVGYLDSKQVELMLDLFGAMRVRDFTIAQLMAAAESHQRFSSLDISEILKLLFECSAIGNLRQTDNGNVFTFKFRNRNSTLNFDEKIILHRGMWKALNLA